MTLLSNAAPIHESSPILPNSNYVNVAASNGRVPTNNLNSKIRYGCGGNPPWQTVPISDVNVTTPERALSNLPFSRNNQLGGYRYSKKRKAQGLKKKKNSKKKNKSKKTKKHKRKTYKKKNYRKKSRKYQKGGAMLPLGSANLKGDQAIPASVVLNNIPYSQGYTINEKSNTDFGALANPIPFESYAKCPPQIKFN